MSKVLWKAGTFVYPVPAVMVSCGDMENSNIITVAWTGIVNTNPAMVYISVRPSRYSYDLIKKSGEFIINLTNENLAYTTDWCGVKSGKNVDKFKEMKLEKEKANFVKCPMIKEAPVSVECKVVEIKEYGTHHMFIAEVLGINADDKYIDKKGAFDISKCDLIAYSNGHYYTLGNKIGRFGFSVQKQPEKSKKIEKNTDKKSEKEHKKDYKKEEKRPAKYGKKTGSKTNFSNKKSSFKPKSKNSRPTKKYKG